MARPSQRDRVLDAYTDLVVDTGPGAVTLEAVATRAGVSKGGLLYHFGTKDALLDGLVARAEEQTAAEIAEARGAAEGLVRWYVRTSATDAAAGSPTHRTMVALYVLSAGEPRAADAARRTMAAWQAALDAVVDDPLTAHLVAVLGDGLYLRAIVGDEAPVLARDWDAVLAALGVVTP